MKSPSNPNKRVVLINPPLDNNPKGTGTEFLPLNLIALATRLRLEGVPVSLADLKAGDSDYLNMIRECPEDEVVVGIGVYKNSLKAAVEIAAKCKELQSRIKKEVKVVIGGADATLFGVHYLPLYKNVIDGIVLGHGEGALIDIANGRDPANLLTEDSKKNGVKVTHGHTANLDCQFPYDYSDLNLRDYWRHADKNFSTKGSRFELDDLDRPLMINTQRGCYFQCGTKEKVKKCVFCCRPDKKWVAISPNKFWDKLYGVMQETGANCVSDLCYDFLGNIEWFKELALRKPTYFTYPFKYIFADGLHLSDEKVVGLLADKLNLHAVLNSIEHGDEQCQSAFGKVYTAKQTSIALDLLDKHKIASRLSFIVGAPRTNNFEGESEKTVNNFFDYLEDVVSHECIQLIVGGSLVPVAGSRIYYQMMARGKHSPEYRQQLPFIDMKAMTKHYFDEYTRISLVRADEAAEQIKAMFPKDVIRA